MIIVAWAALAIAILALVFVIFQNQWLSKDGLSNMVKLKKGSPSYDFFKAFHAHLEAETEDDLIETFNVAADLYNDLHSEEMRKLSFEARAYMLNWSMINDAVGTMMGEVTFTPDFNPDDKEGDTDV